MINDKNQYFNIAENPENKYTVEMYSKKLKEMRHFSNKPITIK